MDKYERSIFCGTKTKTSSLKASSFIAVSVSASNTSPGAPRWALFRFSISFLFQVQRGNQMILGKYTIPIGS